MQGEISMKIGACGSLLGLTYPLAKEIGFDYMEIPFRDLGKITDEGGKGENNNVVGGKHGQNGNDKIQIEEQPFLASSRPSQRFGGEITEEAVFIQENGKHRHGKKQDQYFQGIDGGIRRQGGSHRGRGGMTAQKQNGGTSKDYDPVGIHLFATYADAGKEQYACNHQKASQYADGNGKQHMYLKSFFYLA